MRIVGRVPGRQIPFGLRQGWRRGHGETGNEA
jgi:hypothetical protein